MSVNVATVACIVANELPRLGITLPEPAGSFVEALAQCHREGKPAPDNWLELAADVFDALVPSRAEARVRRTIVEDHRPDSDASSGSTPPAAKPTRSRRKPDAPASTEPTPTT